MVVGLAVEGIEEKTVVGREAVACVVAAAETAEKCTAAAVEASAAVVAYRIVAGKCVAVDTCVAASASGGS